MTKAKMKKSFQAATLTLAATVLLAACGGGGGGGAADSGTGGGSTTPVTPVTPPSSTAAALTGRWVNDQGAWVARWLAPAQGESQSPVWLLSTDGKRLAYLTAKVDSNSVVTASGTTFNLDPANSSTSAVSWTGSYNAQQAKVTFADGSSMTRDVPQSLAIQSEATGVWTTSLGNALLDVTFTIDSQGVLTGSSTTGCTYAGAVVVRPESFVYDARFTEVCPDKTQVLLNGIATLSASKQNLTFTTMTADRLYAKALFFGKP